MRRNPVKPQTISHGGCFPSDTRLLVGVEQWWAEQKAIVRTYLWDCPTDINLFGTHYGPTVRRQWAAMTAAIAKSVEGLFAPPWSVNRAYESGMATMWGWDFPWEPINEPVKKWRFHVTRLRGLFLFGVIVPWRRWNPAYAKWEYSAGFGYWMVALRQEIVGYRPKSR